MSRKCNFVYLVYCNREDQKLVYGVYANKQAAVKYAVGLIRYRKERAQHIGCNFNYYHFHPLPSKSVLQHSKNKKSFDYRELTVFSACLKIDDNSPFGDDKCVIQVIRNIVN